ncbi:hypothetical protein [Mycolicibacterium cosmeticum]
MACTRHWVNGAVPVRLRITVYPWAFDEFTVSWAFDGTDGAAAVIG